MDGFVAEIAAASQEQSQGLQQVSTAVTQMDQVTQANAARAEQSAEAAAELQGQAIELAQAVEVLQSRSGYRSNAHTCKPAKRADPPPAAAGRPSNGLVRERVALASV